MLCPRCVLRKKHRLYLAFSYSSLSSFDEVVHGVLVADTDTFLATAPVMSSRDVSVSSGVRLASCQLFAPAKSGEAGSPGVAAALCSIGGCFAFSLAF